MSASKEAVQVLFVNVPRMVNVFKMNCVLHSRQLTPSNRRIRA